MSIARKILENTFVQIFGKLVTASLSLVVLKVLSRTLGTAGYGDYTTVYQYLAFFGIIADFGIYTIAVREMSRDHTRMEKILGNVMGLRTFLGILAMGLAAVSVFLIPIYKGTLIPMGVLIATLATLFTLLNSTVSSVLQVHLKMQYATISLVIGKVVAVAYMVWVAFFAFTGDPVSAFYHFLWSGVLGNLVNFLITTYYTRRYCKITYQFDFAYWKEVFVTSFPFGIALILSTLYFRIDVLLMTFILPHSQTLAGGKEACVSTLCSDTEIGLFGIAMRMLELFVIVPLYFMNSVLPVMTRLVDEGSAKVRSLMQYSFDFLLALSLPLLVGGFILARPIVLFISGPEFLGGNLYRFGSDSAVRILMFAMLFSFINTLFGFTLVVLNRQTRLLAINAVAVVFNLAGNFLLIPHFGFRGAAWVSVLSELIILVLAYGATQKKLGFHMSFGPFFKILLSSAAMGVAVNLGFHLIPHFNPYLQLGILVPIGGLIYVFLMFKTKAVTPEMIALLRKREPVGEEAPLPSGEI